MCSASTRSGGAHGAVSGLFYARRADAGPGECAEVTGGGSAGFAGSDPMRRVAQWQLLLLTGRAARLPLRSLAARPSIAGRPADVVRDSVTLLRGHGVTRLHWSAYAVIAVASVALASPSGAMPDCCGGARAAQKAPGRALDLAGAAAFLTALANHRPDFSLDPPRK